MALLIRRSILMQSFFAAYLAFSVFLTPAFAQHPAGRVAAPPVTVPPMPRPPVFHAPIYQAPIHQAPVFQAPVYHTPAYAPPYAPRVSGSAPMRPIGTISVRPPYVPGRPFPPRSQFYFFPVVNAPFWPSNFCWWSSCNPLWTYTLIYNAAPVSQWNPTSVFPPAPETPVYIYGAERLENPQLFLKDGTTLYVTDYWLVDGQLHFMLIEQAGIKPEERVIPFDELDLQKTIDVNTSRGFRFMLRNEPFEQYVRDHPEGPPAEITAPHQ
jgi:hypothetical protein